MTDHPLSTSAALWRRLAAMTYDSLLLVAVSMAYAAVAIVLKVILSGAPAEGDFTPAVGGWWFQLGWVLTLMGFFVVFWHRGGQTLGMQTWRLKLERLDGGRPTWRQLWLRAALAPLSLGLLGLGYFWRYLDRDRRTWHGRLSGTRVVLLAKKKRRQKRSAGAAQEQQTEGE